MSVDVQLENIKRDVASLNNLSDHATKQILAWEEELRGVGVRAEMLTRAGLMAYERAGKDSYYRFTLDGVLIRNLPRVERILAYRAIPQLIPVIHRKFKELLDSVTIPQQHGTIGPEPSRQRAESYNLPKRDTSRRLGDVHLRHRFEDRRH